MDILNIIKNAVDQNLNLEIEYEKDSGERSVRQLSDVQYSDEYGSGYTHISAFCHVRKEDRTFKIDRIRNAVIINNNGNNSSQAIAIQSINFPKDYKFNPNKKIYRLYGKDYDK